MARGGRNARRSADFQHFAQSGALNGVKLLHAWVAHLVGAHAECGHDFRSKHPQVQPVVIHAAPGIHEAEVHTQTLFGDKSGQRGRRVGWVIGVLPVAKW